MLPTPRFGDLQTATDTYGDRCTNTKVNPWPQPGENPKWSSPHNGLMVQSPPDENMHIKTNSFVSRVVPVARRHATLSSLPTTKEDSSNINDQAIRFSAQTVDAVPWEVQVNRAPGTGALSRESQGPIHSYLCRHRVCFTSNPSRSNSVAKKAKQRSRSTEPWVDAAKQVEHLPRMMKRPDFIREMSIQRPNAYKSHIRLKALKGIQRSVLDMCY